MGTNEALRGIDTLPDRALTDRARDGDARAFEVLLRRYQRQMYTLARRILGPRQDAAADAEDVVQEAFVRAWRTLPGFRGEAKFSTWMYRIVTNQALTQLRRARADVPLDTERDDPPDATHHGPEARAEQSALSGAFTVALQRLPDDVRAAWLLREVEHCSYEEVATIMGVTLSTARGRIARARTGLATAMEEWR